jgi:DNA-binding response OmpR family regulator
VKTILMIEGEKKTAELTRDYLEAAGYDVTICENGTDGLRMAEEQSYDLLMLNAVLPDTDGFCLCRTLRKTQDQPILMLSENGSEADAVRGLGVGADDYITLPFRPSEMTARVQAHLRMVERLAGKAGKKKKPVEKIESGTLAILLPYHEVQVKGETVSLTSKEYDLLLFLASNPGVVFSRETLFEQVWGMENVGDPATVTVHINRLREKIEENPSQPQLIQTVWGSGYRFRKQQL